MIDRARRYCVPCEITWHGPAACLGCGQEGNLSRHPPPGWPATEPVAEATEATREAAAAWHEAWVRRVER